MKTLLKVLGGAAALLLMAGVLLTLTGWAMGGKSGVEGDLPRWKTVSGFPHIELPASADGEDGDRHLAPFSRVEIRVDLGEVTIETGQDYGVDLSWRTGGAGYRLHYTNEEGTLKVWSTSRPGVRLDEGGSAGGTVTVFVPEGVCLDKTDVEVSLGDAALSGLRTGELTVVAELGEVSMEDVTADRAGLTLDLGGLTMSGCSFGAADFQLALGSLKADGLTVTDRLTARAELGGIELEGRLEGRTELSADMGGIRVATSLPREAYGYDLRADLGRISLDGEHMGGTAACPEARCFLRAEASMGSIEIAFGA